MLGCRSEMLRLYFYSCYEMILQTLFSSEMERLIFSRPKDANGVRHVREKFVKPTVHLKCGQRAHCSQILSASKTGTRKQFQWNTLMSFSSNKLDLSTRTITGKMSSSYLQDPKVICIVARMAYTPFKYVKSDNNDLDILLEPKILTIRG